MSRVPPLLFQSKAVTSESVTAWSDHGDALRGAGKSTRHIIPLNPGQSGTQQSHSGAFFLGPVREKRVSGGFSTSNQIQLFWFVAQRYAQLPPSSTPSLLQEALHLFLSVRGQIHVQAVVKLAVSLSTWAEIR